MSVRAVRLVSAILLALAVSGSHAQGPSAEDPAAPELELIVDEYDRTTPRRSLSGYLTAAQERDFETAAEYLDLRNLPANTKKFEGHVLARALAVVIERELWLDFDEISDHPDGAGGDGLPSYRDRFAELESADGTIELLMQRVPRGDGEFIWKISNRTVGRIPALYSEFGYGPVEEYFIGILPDITILNIELFKWVIVIGAAIVAYPLLYLLLTGLSFLLVRKPSPTRDEVRRFLTRPFLWLLLIMITNRVTYSLGLGIEAQRFADAHTIDIAILTWVMWSAVNLVRSILRGRLESRGKRGAVVLLDPIGSAVKIVIVILAILLWLSNLGFNITALLAGLGVGGLAVALALQKPLEDLFGAVTLFSQQPARVGDYCRFGDITGTIEEIGLRTTRIRTDGNTVVSIPNARIAGDVLDNISARKTIWYHPKLTLRYDSTAEQLREILGKTQDYLVDHPKVVADPCRVRLAGFGRDGIEIDVYAYVDTGNYAEFLEISEQLNLAIVDIITQSGTEFAVPIPRVGEPK